MMYETNDLQTYRAKPSLRISLFEILAGLYIAHKLIPAVGHYMPAIVYLGIFGLLCLYGIMTAVMRKHLQKMLPVFLLPLLACVRYVIQGATANIPIYMYSQLQMIMYGVIAFYVMENRETEPPKKWLAFILICYVFTAITTTIGCTRFPLAARYLASVESTTDGQYILYTKNNIGGFTFIYEITLLTPLISYLIKEKKINRLLGVAILVLFGVTILTAEYTTALVLFVITIPIMFFGKITKRKLTAIFVLLILFFLVGTQWIADLLQSLSERMESETVSARFEYLSQILSGNTITDTENSGDRMSLYQLSWDEFTRTLGLGNWGRAPTGGHSYLLDTIGVYGIVGVAVLIIFYRYIYRMHIKPYWKDRLFGYIYYLLIMCLLLALLNPKSFLFVLIGVLPLFAEVYQDRKTGDENEITVDGQ